MQMLTGNWTSSGFEQRTYTQVGDSGYNITDGSTFTAKAVEYSCSVHTSSQEVYPFKDNKWAVASNIAHAALFFPHCAMTAVGNTIGVAKGLIVGSYRSYQNRADKDFTVSNAYAPVVASGKQALKSGGVALLGAVACNGALGLFGYSISTELFGYNIGQIAAIGFVGVAALHGVYNPHGHQRLINRTVENWVSPKPISDQQAHDMKLHQRAISILDGSYSLTRLLRLNYMGKADMAVNKKRVFEEVKKD